MATLSLAGTGGSQTQPLFWEKNKMMKTIKTGFYASVAVASVCVGAQAEDLFNLKSLMQNLNTNDARSIASIQVPGGYSINPTADAAPADAGAAVEEPFTEVKVSGYIKTGLIFSEQKDGSPAVAGRPSTQRDASTDIDTEIGINVKGSVQSSLGEVGATIQTKWDIAESTNNAATTALRDEGAVGFWQFLPTMKLEMGRSNTGRLENGFDKNTRRLWTFANRRVRTESAGNGFFDRDAYNAFMGLAYADGPLTFYTRINDATRGVGGGGYDDDAFGGSAKATYTTDMFALELAGGYWGQDDAELLPVAQQTGVKWLAGAGAELNFISGLPISLAAQTGRLHNDTETLNFSGSVGFTLTDEISAGFSAGWKRISNVPAGSTTDLNHTEKALHAEIFYAPLSNILIGLEGDYLNDDKLKTTTNSAFYSNTGYTGALVARYSF
jgi:hypothetical protein